MVTRLPFKLPEFAPRVTWASTRAREVWEPRMQRVSTAWLEVERQSVVRGVRLSALQNVDPEALPALMRDLAPHGVVVLPLGKTARAQGYQSASVFPIGNDWDYRTAITRPDLAARWAEAWAAQADGAIGLLLGTPQCCREFFRRVWTQERWFDTTVPMFRNTEQRTGLNMFWRWLGVRPVSHLPCSPACVESLTLAEQCQQLLPEPERTWHREILSWPVKYTSLHGIVEITTPILRMSVPTDALAERVEIRYLGSGYPEEGATGVDFPHRSGTAKPVPVQLTRSQNPGYNGFSSREAQDAAHRTLLSVLPPGPFETVLDLGCGDGTLLTKIPARRRIGVESDAFRARHARLDRVVVGDCTDRTLVRQLLTEERPDLVIAQRDRNPPNSLPGQRVLSYSYEAGAGPPVLAPS